ncbi:MAG TPA: M48 family metalloprotease, partial [Cyclobacteriaceae bacterium]|nr:M48 family metalloprotease [Cyclobacteriaceae bacterium]
MLKKILVLWTIALLVFACAKVPVTGRKQLSLIPNSQLIPMAEEQYREVLSQSKLSTNAEQVALIRNSGVRIQKAVEQYMAEKGLSRELQLFKWEFNLIEENTVNAWCMPGGLVAFYTGILPVCADELGVAVVMGHEVAHA